MSSIVPKIRILALASAAAAMPAWAATVEVSHADPAGFADVGSTPAQRDANVAELERHLRLLGERRLGADLSLRIELLDVDLAGWTRPTRHGTSELRVLRGSADWPRITLHYTLRRGEQVLHEGRESLSDLSYLQRLPGHGGSESLYHEKRMLDEWFAKRFATTD